MCSATLSKQPYHTSDVEDLLPFKCNCKGRQGVLKRSLQGVNEVTDKSTHINELNFVKYSPMALDPTNSPQQQGRIFYILSLST
jgi:hypothetical protein